MQQLCSAAAAAGGGKRIQLLEIVRKFRNSNLQSSLNLLFPGGEILLSSIVDPNTLNPDPGLCILKKQKLK